VWQVAAEHPGEFAFQVEAAAQSAKAERKQVLSVVEKRIRDTNINRSLPLGTRSRAAHAPGRKQQSSEQFSIAASKL